MRVTLKRGSLPERLLRRAFDAAFRVDSGAHDNPRIRVVDDPAEILPGIWDRTIQLGSCGWRAGHPFNDNELILLCHLAAAGWRPIVEFGTFDGRTAYNLALNAGDSIVVTIDLSSADAGSNAEGGAYGSYVSGACIAAAPPAVRSRIEQIHSDSRRVDLGHLHGRVGLVFIDGGHSEDVCRHDTSLALKLVRPGGIVSWDDYTPHWPGVKAVVDEVSERLPLYHLPRYGLVLYLDAAPATSFNASKKI